jgi:hypothetical protein
VVGGAGAGGRRGERIDAAVEGFCHGGGFDSDLEGGGGVGAARDVRSRYRAIMGIDSEKSLQKQHSRIRYEGQVIVN